MTNDPICPERGVPQSECPPFCPHDIWHAAFLRVLERCEELKAKVAESQWNALEMARKADAAERRAEEAEFHVEQLRDARDRAEATEALYEAESLTDDWRRIAYEMTARAEDAESQVARVQGVLASACHHCGQGPDDPDGDHSCPCPLGGGECFKHAVAPVVSLDLIRAAIGGPVEPPLLDERDFESEASGG